MGGVLTVFLVLAGAWTLYLVAFRKLVVYDWEAGLRYRDGRFAERLGPGAHRLWRWQSEVTVFDLRKRTATVAGQEVPSEDHVSLRFSLAITHEIEDPGKAAHACQDWSGELHVAAQLALRAVVASRKADALVAQRAELGRELAAALAEPARALGLKLHAVEVKDLVFPGDLKRVFASVVVAQKEAQAAIERARGQTAVLRSLANAAKLVEDSPALGQLLALQAVATSGGSVVVGAPAPVVPPAAPRAPDAT